MNIIIGSYTPYWGHTALAGRDGKLYALRSLAEGSSLCVFNMPDCEPGIITLDDLVPIGEYPTPGKNSCHILLLDKQVVVSDYTSGTLSLYDTNRKGIPKAEPELIKFHGSGPDPVRQTSPHIHSSWLSPDGETVVTVDLGCDKIYRFPVRKGRLSVEEMESFSLPEGCGPRHCAFNADGTRLYVVTELSDEVLVYTYPDMKLLQRCLVNESRPRGGAHIELSNDGRFLYTSSRLEKDGLAVFHIVEDGMIRKQSYHYTGKHPRHFALSEDGLTLLSACRDDDKIEFFSIDAADGSLCKKGEYNLYKPVFIMIKH